MAIKWKNKYSIFVATFLLVVGSMLIIHNSGGNRATTVSDYRLENELGQQVVRHYLEQFDEDSLTTEMVSNEQVANYRYEYGDLETQVQDIYEQYKERIKAAKNSREDETVKSLTEERDQKSLEIVANYTNNQRVKEKIVKRDGAQVMEVRAKLLEELQSASTKYLDANYVYYLTGDEGLVLTNLADKGTISGAKEIKAAMAKEKTRSVKKKRIWVSWPEELLGIGMFWNGGATGNLEAEGYVAVKENSTVAIANQKALQKAQKQSLFVALGIILLLSGVILGLSFILGPVYFSEQADFVQRLPLDLRLMLLAGIGMVSFLTWRQIQPGLPLFAMRTLYFFLCAYAGVFIGLCLLKNLWLAVKKAEGYPDFPTQAKSSLLRRASKGVRRWFNRLPTTLRLVLVGCYFGGVALGSMALMYGVGGMEVLVVVFLPLVTVGSLPLIVREYRLAKVLKKPQAILEGNQEVALRSELLEDVSANLDHLNQIVSLTHANRQRSESLKTELLTNVSHDLRTPLTSIISYGDLLTKDNLQAEDRQAYTAIINRKAMRMKNLIDDLFAVTKMNNGEITLNRKLINLGQLLQQSIAEYGEELADKELKLIYTKPEEPVMLEIDGERMWRVFDNLIGNVVKYAMPQTRVYLKLEVGAEVKIELKNISMHELNEDASNLVERFTRGDEARNTEGSGLGLAIANSIVTLHDGRFEIVVDGDMFKIQLFLPKPTE